jgi:predicted site-specific integrase-resolvase
VSDPRRNLLNDADAATRVGVSRSTISRWVTSGLLRVAGTVAGRRYFLVIDLLEAERATRRTGKSRR